MDLHDYETAIERSTDPAEIWQHVTAYFRAERVQRIAYRHMAPLGAPDADVLRFRQEGYPEEAFERYLSEQLYKVDPRMQYAKRTAEPFYWDDVPEFIPESERDHAMLALMSDAGMPNGLGVPVFGPNGRNGFFAIVLPKGVSRLPPDTLLDFQWICQLAHVRYCTMLLEDIGPQPELSPRESEVLAWVARGKSNTSIAGILGISAHTVDAHLRRIYLKLGVFDRITATVRGLGVGLIHAEP